jgi:hypothetical protein
MRKLEELQIVPKLRRRELKVSQPGPIPKLSEAVFPPRLAQRILQTVHPRKLGKKARQKYDNEQNNCHDDFILHDQLLILSVAHNDVS